MIPSLRKTLLATFGIVSITKDKLQKTIDEFVERGELEREQGNRLLNALLERGAKEHHHSPDEAPGLLRRLDALDGLGVLDRLGDGVERVLRRSPVATRSQLGSLEERIDRLQESRSDETRSAEATSASTHRNDTP